jgi:TonB family protein
MTDAPKSYLWYFPGCPLKVYLGLEFVENLQRHIALLPQAGREDGLLLGRTGAGKAEVTGFEPGRDQSEEPAAAIASLVKEAGKTAAVGYYRVERGAALHFTAQDRAVADSLFTDPYQIVLLIHAAEMPPNATIYFRDGKDIQAEVSLLEFPFDAGLLLTAEQNRLEAAARRQELNVKPKGNKPAAPAAPPSRKRFRWVAGVVVLAALVLLAAARLFPFDFVHFGPDSGSRGPSIDLRGDFQNGEVRLTWDRSSGVIVHATSGVLTIRDGTAVRQIPLSAQALQHGTISYPPAQDEVQFDLAVSGSGGNVTESALIILPRSPAASVQASTAIPGSTPAPQVPKPPDRNPREESDRAAGDLRQIAPPSGVRQPVKPFSVPPSGPPEGAPVILTTPPALTANSVPASPPVSAPLGDVDLHAPEMPRNGERLSLLTRPSSEPQLTPAVAITKVLPRFRREVTYKRETIEVDVSIDVTGKVDGAKTISPSPQFLAAEAIRAASQWKFKPAIVNGHAVASHMVLRFDFNPNVQ